MVALGSKLLASLFLSPALAHDDGLPVNPELGVPGFPHCFRKHPELQLSVAEAADDLICEQRAAAEGAVKIACVGDSITAGARSSGGNHPYPQQLQILLDSAHGEGAYSVTNLGECGSTMLKSGNSPYWKRAGYKALTSNKWDIVVVMLGTNDAKDKSSGGPDNWQHDCADGASTSDCLFGSDFKDMIAVVRTLGTTSTGPKVYAMVPPPLMSQGAYGMNQTVINDVYPKLVPLIQRESGLDGLIDVFTGMGGLADWRSKYPSSCSTDSRLESCKWFCDKQSCDQCHPNDNGYTHLAEIVQAGLGLEYVVAV